MLADELCSASPYIDNLMGLIRPVVVYYSILYFYIYILFLIEKLCIVYVDAYVPCDGYVLGFLCPYTYIYMYMVACVHHIKFKCVSASPSQLNLRLYAHSHSSYKQIKKAINKCEK